MPLPGPPGHLYPWHYLERDGGRRMVTRVLVKVWTHRHPETIGGDLAVLLTMAAHAGPDTTVGLDYEALAVKTGVSLQEATGPSIGCSNAVTFNLLARDGSR